MKILSLISVLICVCLLSIALTREHSTASPDLQSIATAALGQREGAIIVIDPQTGRIRALVNPEFAFERALPPGSTIKPFTTLTALRAGIIDENSRVRCREEYEHKDDVEVCSHPLDLPPLNPSEALAYSCNYYFATTGERIEPNDLAQTLAEFGFGQPAGVTTGINGEEESGGAIVRAKWQANSAIGEGEFLQATPLQLLMAYTALLNGGRLPTPQLDRSADFKPRVRSQLQIEDAERAIIMAGMRGAVRFGTAEKADLDALPAYVVGKTGTSTQINGFRTHGWFVGLSFAPNKPPEPKNLQLAVVVYLKNAHGSDAAEVAAPLFKAAALFEEAPVKEAAVTKESESPRAPTTNVVVHQVTENKSYEMSLEDYVARVVSVEASTEDEPEALKAVAIAARTFALKNMDRHKDEGYNFCSTTHCQRFESPAPPPPIVAAVEGTAGLVLSDDRDAIADSYFGASCGGMTANVQTLWGAPAPKHLSGVRDDYCNAGFHSRWTDVIKPQRMVAALRSDPRTDVGETIRELTVSRRDQTGRAELVSIFGKQQRMINGWEFKLIVGRALGWNVLKSSRFSISRSGSAFVFRGSGFGHGLGLCQEGSHVMAQRGFKYRDILAKYFPGTTVSQAQTAQISKRQRSSHFVVAGATDAREAERILSVLESQRSALVNRLSAAGIEVHLPNVEIFFNKTTGDFTGRTGMPAWAAAATRNNRIELQPLPLLKKRGILETTLRHELVHVAIDAVGGGQTPRWLAEGIALFIAGEGRKIEHYGKDPAIAPELLEQKLTSAKSAEEMKSAYAAAYKTVQALVRVEGENKLWQRVARRSYDVRVTQSPHR